MKVILNKCYGGFSVSDEAYELYAKKKGLKLYRYGVDDETDEYKKGLCNYLTYYFTEDFGDKVPKKNIDWNKSLYLNYTYREDPVLIKVVEELGSKASGRFGDLVVVEIPDNLNYVIDDYDGIETLRPAGPTW